MIIQCAQCKARFRLDDSKVSDAGIKVRCSKCKHIFVVKREPPVEEADLDVLLQGLDTSSAGTAIASGAATAAVGAAEQEALAAESAMPSAQSSCGAAVEEPSASAVAESSGELEGFSFGEESPETEKMVADFGEEFRPEEPFGDIEFDRDASTDVAIPHGPVLSVQDSALSGPGMPHEEGGTHDEEEISFGEVSPEAFAAATDVSSAGAEGSEEEEISFEFEEDEEGDYGEAAAAEESAAGDVDFGEIDFGIEDTEAEPSRGAAVIFPIPPDPEVAVVSESEPVAVDPFAGDAVESSVPIANGEGGPPLGIASRRKGKSLLPVAVITLSVLVIVALAGFGFYFFKEGPEALNRLGVGFLAEWFGMESREEGAISLDKVSGAYIVNSEAGELFVIRGEAVNNYRKPRAAIQVRGALMGAGGQAIVQKVAYCGNSLTDDQIATLPFARIDAAMGNQFGDSLANLGVQPGKRIPFVVVIAGVPKDAVDYSVEVVGSTVASQ